MVKKWFWRGFGLGGFIFLIIAFYGYNKFVASPDISLEQLEVEDLQGNSVDFALYKGKPLVVNYWATWCAPCLRELPRFEQVRQRFAGDVNFVMISDESIKKINSFHNSMPYEFTFFRSAKKLSEYGINEMTSIPTTYFYNALGILKAKHSGELDVERLLMLIGELD